MGEVHPDVAKYVEQLGEESYRLKHVLAGIHSSSVALLYNPCAGPHPRLVKVFADALAEFKQTREIYLATHSPVLLSEIPPEEIFEYRNGTLQCIVPEHEELLEQYTPGTLYMTGVIGW